LAPPACRIGSAPSTSPPVTNPTRTPAATAASIIARAKVRFGGELGAVGTAAVANRPDRCTTTPTDADTAGHRSTPARARTRGQEHADLAVLDPAGGARVLAQRRG